MNIEAINTPVTFNVLDGNELCTLKVKRLSLAELKQRVQYITDSVLERQRKEFVDLASMLPDAERTSFLIAAAKQNKITADDLDAALDSVMCLCYTLKLATGETEERISKLFRDDTENVARAYLYALGVDTDAIATVDKKEGAVVNPAPFPVP